MACAVGLAGCANSFGDLSNPADSAGGPSAVSAQSAAVAPDLAKAAAQFTAASTPGNAGYKIGPLDVLDITVFKIPELARSVQVTDNGSINFPLIGDVPTSGRTPQDLERLIAARLGARYVQSPQVSVFVKEYNSQRVTVDGAVKKPGVYPLKGRSSLLQLIAQAEGLDKDSASNVAVIFRQTPDGRAAAKFNLDDIRSGSAQDPAILQGDTIVVDSSSAKIAFGYVVKALPAASLFTLF